MSVPRWRPIESAYRWRVPRRIVEEPDEEHSEWTVIGPMLDALAEGDGAFERVKDGPRKIILRGDDPLHSESELWVKRYIRDRGTTRLKQLLGRADPARREAEMTLRAAAADVPTSLPIACGTRRLGAETEAISIYRSPKHARRLGAVLFDLDLEAPTDRAVADRLLRRVLASLRKLHDSARLIHHDVNMGNVLVAPDGDGFFLIDFHRCRRRLPFVHLRQRTVDLSKPYHFVDRIYTREAWFELLEAYTQGNSVLLEGIQKHWDEVCESRMARKADVIVKNCLRTRVYFVREEIDTPWGRSVVVRDRDTPLDWVERAIERVREQHDDSSHEETPEAFPAVKAGRESSGNPLARAAWREAVAAACRSETEWAPVALVEPLKAASQPAYLWKKAFDTFPKGQPRYALSWTFALERMSEQSFVENLGRRTE